ncbi:MAG: LLM class flavin-dependent oxidoreductase [Acidimicrobiales bacterium]
MRAALRGRGAGAILGFVAPRRAEDVRRLEDLGVSSLWVGGHVASVNPSPEAVSWLARLVEQSRTSVVGSAILLLPLYPPAIIAKQLADLDQASGGRLAIGIGVGGEYPSDFAAAEVPMDERGSRTDESVALLRRFWTAEPITHAGRHHHFEDVRIHPAPLQRGGPPLIIAGRQPVAMRRAGRLGDGWMPYLYSPERYARSVATVRQEAEAVDRDLSNFVWSAYVFVSLDDDPAQARKAALNFLGTTYRSDFDQLLDRVACVGNVEQVTSKLTTFVGAGARHLVIAPLGPDHMSTAERIVKEVAPLLAPMDSGS